MSRYKTLLFDADMTLFDFDAAERAAFSIVMDSHGIEYDEAGFSRYKRINAQLWEEFGRGEITKEYLQRQRFGCFIETITPVPDICGETLNLAFLDALADCSELFDGALDLCRELSRKYELYIVTNGVSYTQKKRFYASPIREYFRDIFVSEDAGAQKPMPEYFDYVFARIGEEKRSTSVIIGDSLSSDIAGGIAAGIDTVWYNPKGSENTTDIIPTATVDSYVSLRAFIES